MRLGERLQLPPGFCLECGHHEDHHMLGEDGKMLCDTEVRDYGTLDCSCPGLRLCAACEGDPEAHDLHVCARGGTTEPNFTTSEPHFVVTDPVKTTGGRPKR